MSVDLTVPLQVFEGEPLICILWEGRHVNVAESQVERRPHWESHEGAEVFVDEWFRGDLSVKRSVIAILKPQATAAGEAGALKR